MPRFASEGGPPGGHASFHAWLRELDAGQGRLAVHAFLPPRGGETAEALPAPWAAASRELGIVPWRHQEQALRHLAAGDDVVVATPTASGKSLAYQLPAVTSAGEGASALMLFPTKALGRDQLTSLRGMAHRLGQPEVEARYTVYDGDTPRDARSARRQRADVVVTNPDMAHLGILPFHAAWAPFLSRLAWIVVDELHAYRGVLGSHVGNVLRRLLRVCAAYGASETELAEMQQIIAQLCRYPVSGLLAAKQLLADAAAMEGGYLF